MFQLRSVVWVKLPAGVERDRFQLSGTIAKLINYVRSMTAVESVVTTGAGELEQLTRMIDA